jgi:hypothetical protein
MSACQAGECRVPECCGGFVLATCAREGCKTVVGMEGDPCLEHEDCECGEPLTFATYKIGLCPDCRPDAPQERAELFHDRMTNR